MLCNVCPFLNDKISIYMRPVRGWFGVKYNICRVRRKGITVCSEQRLSLWLHCIIASGTDYQIARKFWNHRGQYCTLNPIARKNWISQPSVGQKQLHNQAMNKHARITLDKHIASKYLWFERKTPLYLYVIVRFTADNPNVHGYAQWIRRFFFTKITQYFFSMVILPNTEVWL